MSDASQFNVKIIEFAPDFSLLTSGDQDPAASAALAAQIEAIFDQARTGGAPKKRSKGPRGKTKAAPTKERVSKTKRPAVKRQTKKKATKD